MTTRYTHASDGETDARTMTTTSEQLPYNTPISTHYSWSASMKFSAIMKSALIVAMLFLVGSEAFAQLPVRTRQLQLIGSTNTSAITMQAVGNVTPYNINWPIADGTSPVPSSPAWVAGDSGYVKVRMSAAGTMALEWERGAVIDGDGDVDGNGEEVAYFSDNNTIISHPTFTFNGNGEVRVGGGTTTPNDGTFIVRTTGNVANATITAVDGTIEMGSAAQSGTLVLNDGSSNFVTFVTGDQDADATVRIDTLPAGTYFVTPATNAAADGTDGYILESNANGTATWVPNPNQFYQFGRRDVTAGEDGTFTATINFTTPFAAPINDPDEITVTVSLMSGAGTIIEITNITLTGFTIQSTAPLAAATDTFMWMANAVDTIP